MPLRAAVAPVNAPRSWPKSSDSTRLAGTAVQSNTTNGPFARGLLSWSASASDLLAGARLTLDDHGDVALSETRAERIEPLHRVALADQPGERALPRCVAGSAGGRRIDVDLEHRVANAQQLAAVSVRVDDVERAERRPVGRALVDDAKPSALDLERDVAPRDGMVAELQGGGGTLAEEHRRRLRPIDAKLAPRVDSFNDTNDERGGLGGPCGVGRVCDCRVVQALGVVCHGSATYDWPRRNANAGGSRPVSLAGRGVGCRPVRMTTGRRTRTRARPRCSRDHRPCPPCTRLGTDRLS